MSISMKASGGSPISDAELLTALKNYIEGRKLSNVLLLPPDLTRLHSYAGKITALYYNMLKATCQVDIMPALGTHDAMTREECLEFFGPDVPYEAILSHNWRNDIVKIGQVPSAFVSEVSGGLIDYPIDVEVNKRLMDPSYDLMKWLAWPTTAKTYLWAVAEKPLLIVLISWELSMAWKE